MAKQSTLIMTLAGGNNSSELIDRKGKEEWEFKIVFPNLSIDKNNLLLYLRHHTFSESFMDFYTLNELHSGYYLKFVPCFLLVGLENSSFVKNTNMKGEVTFHYKSCKQVLLVLQALTIKTRNRED